MKLNLSLSEAQAICGRELRSAGDYTSKPTQRMSRGELQRLLAAASKRPTLRSGQAPRQLAQPECTPVGQEPARTLLQSRFRASFGPVSKSVEAQVAKGVDAQVSKGVAA